MLKQGRDPIKNIQLINRPRRKAKGQRGSWFATVGEERLPCVHKHWFQKGAIYKDPGCLNDSSRWREFFDALQKKGRVIMTDDEFSPDQKNFRRTGYIATFSVEDLRVSAGCLQFRFVDRLEELI